MKKYEKPELVITLLKEEEIMGTGSPSPGFTAGIKAFKGGQSGQSNVINF